MQASIAMRRGMVRSQIVSRGVVDPRVITAMELVPREEFVPEQHRALAYEDVPLPIEDGQTISQPYVVALMAEAAAVRPTDRVLEVGAGSGYASAVLACLGAEVIAVERHPALAEIARIRLERLGFRKVTVLQGDGSVGVPTRSPFDAIVVSAGGPDVPPHLVEQLAPGGRLVIPVGHRPQDQELVRITREADGTLRRESLGAVRFVPLVGAAGWSAGPARPLPRRRAARGSTVRAEVAAAAIDVACEPFTSVDAVDLSPLMARIGSARVVLIGESTHGTSEFYRLRARITRALVERKGFSVVALEADWPTRARARRARGARTRLPALPVVDVAEPRDRRVRRLAAVAPRHARAPRRAHPRARHLRHAPFDRGGARIPRRERPGRGRARQAAVRLPRAVGG
jgi:protein-L-isoaspartate(D-aspartate) O-methyltransferase